MAVEDEGKHSEHAEATTTSVADAPISAQSSDEPVMSETSTPTPDTTTPPSQVEDRAALIEKAKQFLVSPQIRHEDLAAKRRFLVEKGLTDQEIVGLLQQLPATTPIVPPRTYPQPPPSNLPNMLLGLARIITWVAGGSAFAMLVYYRYLLPLLSRSLQARVSIKAHQKDLLSRLTTSIHNLKETQSETFAILPKPQPTQESSEYKNCHNLEQILAAGGERPQDVPPFSILRCALEEFEALQRDASTEALFEVLTNKLPWLQLEDGSKYQDDLWKTLSTDSAFSYTDTQETSIWKYVAPIPPTPPPAFISLANLRSTMPAQHPEKPSASQHTLEALSEFTGYLTTQIYKTPAYRPLGFNTSHTLKPEEEEIRKEIRALKGLVLNRRSFMGALPARANSTPPI